MSYIKVINKNLPKDMQISETIIYNRLKDPKFNKTNPMEYQDFEDVEKWMKKKILDYNVFTQALCT